MVDRCDAESASRSGARSVEVPNIVEKLAAASGSRLAADGSSAADQSFGWDKKSLPAVSARNRWDEIIFLPSWELGSRDF